MLKDNVIKLEFKVKTRENQILDLKTRSVENNVVINGIEENSIEGANTEVLAKPVFITELGEADVDYKSTDCCFIQDGRQEYPKKVFETNMCAIL